MIHDFNLICYFQGNICCFVQDPSSVAVNWLKVHLREKNVEATTQESLKFNTSLDLAVRYSFSIRSKNFHSMFRRRFGKVLILEDVESISPILLPILRREFVIQGICYYL